MNNNSVRSALELARVLLAFEVERSDEFLLLLERYSKLLSTVDFDDQSLSREELEELAEANQRVLDKAQTAKSLASDGLKKLAQRGKGIRKYIDRYPVRMSTRRPKKG